MPTERKPAQRVGLVQTRGIGDIVIALPIAQALIRSGNTVHWPVDARFVEFLRRAAPQVEFIPIAPADPPTAEAEMARYYVDGPMEELRRAGCSSVFVLYSHLKVKPACVQRPELVPYLTFDQYKYAVAGVPFAEKWNLELQRDAARESRLLESLKLKRPHVCLHLKASQEERRIAIPPAWKQQYDLVFMDERTDSPFDWLSTLEKAEIIVCIDSVFANLVDQLNLPNEKHLICKVHGPFTPVLRNGWHFSVSRS